MVFQVLVSSPLNSWPSFPLLGWKLLAALEADMNSHQLSSAAEDKVQIRLFLESVASYTQLSGQSKRDN